MVRYLINQYFIIWYMYSYSKQIDLINWYSDLTWTDDLYTIKFNRNRWYIIKIDFDGVHILFVL